MALPARRIIVLSALLTGAGMSWAAPRRPLDRVRIHALYHDGEFERILRELAPYGKGECACGKDDSAFAEKHLAVVLAAAPATRELGRYHMFRLLDLSPRADLLDMYVGEEVDAVFEKVRKEHDLRAANAVAKAPDPKPAAISKPAAASLPSAPAFSDAWAKTAEADPRPKARSRPAAVVRSETAPMKTYTRWDALPPAKRSAPVSGPTGPGATVAATTPASTSASLALSETDVAASDQARSESDSSRPAWKKPGVWIGGGAAIAAIAFTLWHTGSDGGGPGKTYAVPASLSK